MKTDLLTQLKVHGLPTPLTEHRFALPRQWRLDYFFPPPYDLGVEVEGGAWVNGRHNRASGWLKDMSKYNELTLLRIRLLRVTPQMVDSGEAVDLIKRALSAGPAS